MFAVLVTFAVLAPTALAGRDAAPMVQVAEGRVSGVTETSTKGRAFHSYYGVPFAKPPVGRLRLKDPLKAEGWEGVRDGSRMPSPCLLVPLAYAAMGVTLAPEDLRGSEDCLYLNIFTPKMETSKKLPVMVWIHGGAYLAGGAHEYLPHVLMNHDIVLVVLQYRVGIMGFLSTEDKVIPGNFGLKDQTLALRWVQDNIHTFGGDANRVTIFGESAGGASVHYHILSPKSKGLFSRAIMQSGSALAPWACHEQHRHVAEEVSKAVGCSKAFGHKDILDCLQKVDGRRLAARFQDFMEWFILPSVALPLVDGDFIPDHPARLMYDGDFNQVDLMAGITRDEGALVTNPMLARKDLFPALQNNFSVFGPVSLMVGPEVGDAVAFSTKVYQRYLGNSTIDHDHIKELTKMNTDYSFAVPHDLTTLYHARVPGLATYRYELKHRSQLSMGDFFNTDIGRHWIPHGDDLYYLFAGGPLLKPSRLPDRLPDLQSQDDLRLRDIVTTMWTNFAATGNPTPDDALGFKWEAAIEDDLRYLALTPSPAMEADQRQEVRDFYASLPTKMNQIFYADRGISKEEILRRSCQEEL
ncbi:cholinesterase 2-like isoform X1 [Penaeus chinensis]|uniref:cholinesterase 2-like isoform X1 n=1 Tax=Penaeus chinensis TaxID=139456 RepID=UPI001FB62793|nr:cholinesterase 2-like isoform X1 [Penaeus chinensis]XP_047475619.1 cholinesterase 2-like isoform X1 [Penaeus chinensis]